jgi:mono/diheme cytochrome c family protein
VKSPLTELDEPTMVEAQRLYLVYCGICHGTKLDGNGPLYKGGEGPFAAKPATLVGDAKYEAMPEGQMYYSATYGKNKMGSYASQLNTRQRWMVIAYIKSKQAGSKPAATTGTATAAATKSATGAATTTTATDSAGKKNQRAWVCECQLKSVLKFPRFQDVVHGADGCRDSFLLIGYFIWQG